VVHIRQSSYVDTTVTNSITYYYVVTAVDSSSNESANSNEASATPIAVQVPTGQALLRVTMIDSSEREYQLSTAEIDSFINWYTRTIGTGTTCYVLNKKIGLQNSKEYLSFDKIISFEVIPLTE
jgi:fibronectin type 3 domain-containing protein